MLHGLILVPYYFLTALATLPLLMLISRLLRLKVAINTLVGAAIAVSVAAIVIVLATPWVELRTLTGRPLIALIVISFVLAAIDVRLARALPLPLDDELHDL